MFADDAALLLAESNKKMLKKSVNTEAKLLFEWLINNKLTLNFKKTKYMLIANNNKLTVKDRKKFRVTLGNYTIHEVDQIKYLGVIVNNNLNWNRHIEYLITKLSQAAGVIYKIRNYLPFNAKILIYNSLVVSHLQYSISAWGNTTQALLTKLQSVQNRIIRYLTYSPPLTNVNDKYKTLKLLNLQDLHFCEVAKFMYNIYNGLAPTTFEDYFQIINHSYNTRRRQASTYTLPQPHTERGKKSLRFNGIEVWAKVPESIKKLKPKQFSFHIKEYILANPL